jgi:hypothetical protein
VKLYGFVERARYSAVGELRWHNITVRVPRCSVCESVYLKAKAWLLGGVVLSILLSGAVLFSGGAIPALFIFIPGAAASYFFGYIRALDTGGIVNRDPNQFPKVREMQNEGWRIGTKPRR